MALFEDEESVQARQGSELQVQFSVMDLTAQQNHQ